MLPSTMLNIFRWALTPQCPEIILETVVISFLSALHPSHHGLREILGKMECENLPVSAASQFFCHSSNILCFATVEALYTILPKVACLASKSVLSFPAIPTPKKQNDRIEITIHNISHNFNYERKNDKFKISLVKVMRVISIV
jgi:hypothetical protein